ncbi:hypothetical protein R3P38DRAFT_2803697 [Favolaschia claudopus]|uniref:Uncharacterized protein n=1 Tax=Favolaschia claudopus TaxID=2862362 RepID=A0AAV9ZSZ2_9AGAR
MSESYEAYSAPHPKTRFSPQFMANVTLGEVVGLVRDDLLPRILPDGSVSKWNWDQTVPVTIPETIVSSREEIQWPTCSPLWPIRRVAFAYSRVTCISIEEAHNS